MKTKTKRGKKNPGATKLILITATSILIFILISWFLLPLAGLKTELIDNIQQPRKLSFNHYINEAIDKYKQEDYIGAYEGLYVMAALGNADAQNYMGKLYHHGYGVGQNHDMALDYYTKAASQGNASAMLGIIMICNGIDTETPDDPTIFIIGTQSMSDAKSKTGSNINLDFSTKPETDKHQNRCRKNSTTWHPEATDKYLPEDQYVIGLLYLFGVGGLEKDIAEAQKWLKKAADNGHSEAQRDFGLLLYINSKDNEQNGKDAVHWIECAATNGDAIAQLMRDYFNEHGKGSEQNNAKAENCPQKASGHQRNSGQENIFASRYLGNIYRALGFFEQDGAIYWYQKASEQGDSTASFTLGELYEKAQDGEKAIQWYQTASDQGGNMGNAAAIRIGCLYKTGKIIAQDGEKAILWYKTASERGDSTASFTLGELYEKAQDGEKAIQWHQKGSNQGNSNSSLNIGRLYEKGKIVPQDSAKSIQWFRKASEQGSSCASFHLAQLYEQSKIGAQDGEKAVQYYQIASKQGHSDAAYFLGQLYEKGEIVAQDHEKAKQWYQIASGQGHSDAASALGRLDEDGEIVTQDNEKARLRHQRSSEPETKQTNEAPASD